MLQIYGTQFWGGDGGIALDADIRQSAPVYTAREEITHLVQAMGSKIEVRNGQLLYKQKCGEALDMTEPPVTTCKSR